MKFSIIAPLFCFLLFQIGLSAQDCTFPLFGQNYSIGQGKINLGAMRFDANNTYIAVGTAQQTNGTNTDPCIVKFDNLGKVMWAKRVPISQNTGFLYNVKTTTDGGYIAVGVINAQPAIIKFSSTGTVQWSRISNDGSGDRGNFGDHFRSVIQTKTGEYVASGSIGLNAVTYVSKFSATGTMLWTRQIGTSSNDWSVGLEEFNDGNLLIASNTTSTTNTYLMKLNVADGSTLWQKQYTSGASNACCDHSFDEITKAADGNFLIVGNWQADVGLFQKVDNNGNIIFAKTIQNAGQAFRSTHSTSTPDGGYTVSQFDYSNQLQRTIIKFDANLNVQWVKKIGGGDEPFVKGVLPQTDGSYVMLANENNGFFIKKTDARGNTCEAMETGNVTVQSVQSQISDGTFDNTVAGSFIDARLVDNPLSISVANRCICPTICTGCFDKDSVKIVGIDTACHNTDFTYKLKGYKCSLFATTWNIAGNGVTVTTKTDTTLTVRFNQGTEVKLTVYIQDSCRRDTLMSKTYVIAAPPILELGADRNICLPTAYTFKAGKGYKSYLWQDGSVDSVFTTSVVGKYWVRVVDSCGAVQSDTVRIIQTIPPNFNITPDTLRMCEGDKVEAIAPTGFASYRWSPSLGVNNNALQRVILTPSVSSKYYCVATTSQGCSTIDSVWVEVKPYYKVAKTATICEGYSYNFGDTILRKAGIYTVRVKSKTGDCDTLSRLTLTVTSSVIKKMSETVCSLKPLRIGDSVFTKAGNYTVILKGRSGACDTSLNLTLIPSNNTQCSCNIYIPNTFSPFSSQGVNDVFFPYGSDCAKSVAIMQIFDRWGELVFTKSDFPLSNESVGWNGTFKGQQLPPDVYVYRIDILLVDGRIERFAGDVTIVR
jgi:gliding motility-associated-like protein